MKKVFLFFFVLQISLPVFAQPKYSQDDFYFYTRGERYELNIWYFCYSVRRVGENHFESYCPPGDNPDRPRNIHQYLSLMSQLRLSDRFDAIYPYFTQHMGLTNEIIVRFTDDKTSRQEATLILMEYIDNDWFSIDQPAFSDDGTFLITLNQDVNPLRLVHSFDEKEERDPRIKWAQPNFIRRIDLR